MQFFLDKFYYYARFRYLDNWFYWRGCAIKRFENSTGGLVMKSFLSEKRARLNGFFEKERSLPKGRTLIKEQIAFWFSFVLVGLIATIFFFVGFLLSRGDLFLFLFLLFEFSLFLFIFVNTPQFFFLWRNSHYLSKHEVYMHVNESGRVVRVDKGGPRIRGARLIKLRGKALLNLIHPPFNDSFTVIKTIIPYDLLNSKRRLKVSFRTVISLKKGVDFQRLWNEVISKEYVNADNFSLEEYVERIIRDNFTTDDLMLLINENDFSGAKNRIRAFLFVKLPLEINFFEIESYSFVNSLSSKCK